MNDYLSPVELRDLTGYVYGKHQIDWLREQGWTFTVAAGKKPKVLRAYRDRRLGASDKPAVAERKRPNFAAA